MGISANRRKEYKKITPNVFLGGRPMVVLYHQSGLPLRELAHLEGYILYRFYDSKHNLLYVGATRDLRLRVEGAKCWKRNAGHRHRKWWQDVAYVTVFGGFRSREGLLRSETRAIQNESPRYNIVDQVPVEEVVTSRGGVRVHGQQLCP